MRGAARMNSYVIGINNKKFYTGIASLPETNNIIQAKQYKIRKYAESDAIKLVMHHRHINRVNIVELTEFLQGK